MKTRVIHHGSPVEWLVVRPTVRIAPDATLADAGERMARANVSALLVGSGRDGIVTERDLSRAVAAGYSTGATVAEFATPNPITVTGKTPIVDAAALMLNEEVRHLVVAMANGDQGIVSMRAVVAVLLSSADDRVWLSQLRLSISGEAITNPMAL
jgi:CBS domain-containing protein